VKLRFHGAGAGWKNGLLATGVLLSLYTIFGFLVLPMLVERSMLDAIEGSLDANAAVEDVSFNPFLLQLEIRGLELTAEQEGRVAAVERFFVDLETRSIFSGVITLAELTVEGFFASVVIDEAGVLNWVAMLAEPESTEEEAEQVAQAETAATEEEGEGGLPAILIEQLNVLQARAHFEDRSRPTPLELRFIPIDLALSQLRLGGEAAAEGSPIDVRLALAGGGRLRVSGDISTQPVTARLDLSIEGFELPQLQPLLDEVASLDLLSGRLGVEAQIRYEPESAQPIGVAGELALDELVVHDPAEGTDLIRLPAVRVRGIEVVAQPVDVAIARIDLVEPYLRFAIAQDGTTNFDRASAAGSVPADPPAADEPPAVEVEEAADVQPDAEEAGPPPSVSIAEIEVRGGGAWFEDLSLSPPFATGIQDLEGGLRGFSLDPSANASLRLEGNTGPHAPVDIKGQFALFAEDPALSLELIFRNLDLTAFTPYSGRFAGYQIEQGRMDLDLQYTLAGVRLKGSNAFLIDQLTLGERVKSPDALTLPVALGIALLKDAKGRIDLDLLVEGNVDDPEFSVGGLVWKAFVNLLTKAVTKPFGALASVTGGQAPPESVDFEPGSADLGARQATDLELLAKALAKRPGLGLVVEGGSTRPVDEPALARQRMEDELLAIDRGRDAKPDEVVDVLTLKERKKALKKLRKRLEKSGQLRVLPPPADGRSVRSLSDAEKLARMETEVLNSTAVQPEALTGLAQQRAAAVARFLVEVGEVPEPRIQLGEARVDEEAQEDAMPVARFSLNADTSP
jgi:hypothetical protein